MVQNSLQKAFDFTQEELSLNQNGQLSESQYHRLSMTLQNDFRDRKLSAIKLTLLIALLVLLVGIISKNYLISILVLLLGLMLIDVEITKGPNLLKYRDKMQEVLSTPSVQALSGISKLDFKPDTFNDFYEHSVDQLVISISGEQHASLIEGQYYTFYYLVVFLGYVEILSIQPE